MTCHAIANFHVPIDPVMGKRYYPGEPRRETPDVPMPEYVSSEHDPVDELNLLNPNLK